MPHGFDALTHLDAPVLRDRLAEIVDRAREVGVSGMLVAGWDPQRWDDVLTTAQEAGVNWALGTHPAKVSEGLDVVRLLDAYTPGIVGEIGLDHRGGMPPRSLQRRALRNQLAWARAHEAPVILHAVRAVPEVLHVIEGDGLGPAGGVIHNWTADPELAVRAIELGLHLSIGPQLLRANAHKIVSSLHAIPRDRVLLETDAPDQPLPGMPDPTPSALVKIAAAVAAVWSESTGATLDRTGRTARALFRVDPAVRT